MSLNPAALAAVQPAPLAAKLYLRHAFIPTTEDDPDPFYVRSHQGRWGTQWTLHASGSPPTTWAEYCRQVPELIAEADPTGGLGLRKANLRGLGFLELDVLGRALFALTYDFERVLDVTAQKDALQAGGFDPANLYADDYGECPALAHWATEQGFEAIVAPSAAWQQPDGSVCAVLEPGRPRLTQRDVIVAAGRPTVAVALATSYRAGERPTWLGPEP